MSSVYKTGPSGSAFSLQYNKGDGARLGFVVHSVDTSAIVVVRVFSVVLILVVVPSVISTSTNEGPSGCAVDIVGLAVSINATVNSSTTGGRAVAARLT